MVRIKICGITNLQDALKAAELGVDALGFIFAESKRQISPREAREIIHKLPLFVATVGVFVNRKLEEVEEIADYCGLHVLQFHGEETSSYLTRCQRKKIKAFRVKDETFLEQLPEYEVDAYLLDTYSPLQPGGTGETFNWELALKAKEYGRIILSGGLNPENIARAVKEVQPYAVDTSSGVEITPGKKDFKELAEFVSKIRKTESE